jgi:glycosidase
MPAQTSWLNHSQIYQILVGRFQEANFKDHKTQVFTKLQQFDFKKLTSLGIDTLYLTGIFDNRGPILVQEEAGIDISRTPNRLPSPFSISDHKKPHPYLGRLSDFKSLLTFLHQQGLKVIIDFVPNHTSITHPWVTNHPDYYYHTADNKFVTEFSGDVYKLNYNNPALRQEMTELILHLASWNIDGLRCDMVHLVPMDFWQEAIKVTQSKYPKLVFMGEVYPPSPFDLSIYDTYFNAGFSALYHGLLYNNLISILHQNTPVVDLANHLNYIFSRFSAHTFLNYFANHDDPSPNNLNTYLEALLALILFSPGTPFFFNGTLNNFNRRLAHHYLDLLPTKFQETSHLDPKVAPLFKLAKVLKARYSKVTTTNNLLLLSLETPSPNTLILNLSTSPESLEFLPLNTKGLLHGYSTKDKLLPGQADIFQTTNH